MRGAHIEDQEHRSWKLSLASAIPNFCLLLLAVFTPIVTGILFTLGLLLYIIALGTILAAVIAFVAGATGLATNGVFRISRNPIYIDHFLLLTGYTLMAFQASVLSGIVALFISLVFIAITHFAVLGEEVFLAKKYGEDYFNYKASVRRYL